MYLSFFEKNFIGQTKHGQGSEVEDDGWLVARPAFAAYAAPCQHRGRLQRKVATYLPLSLVLECAWPSV